MTDRKAIDLRLSKGLGNIQCQYCDRPIKLVDALETEFGDPKLQQKVREMEEEVAERRGRQVGTTVSDAKESIGEAIDETVDGFVDDAFDSLGDLDGLPIPLNFDGDDR